MNTTKAGSYGKLIAFFLVAVILLCAFGFAVEGWQPNTNPPLEGGENKPDDKTPDTDKNDQSSGQAPSEPEPERPIYIDAITGLETDEVTSRTKHVCFSVSSTAPLYGIRGTRLLIEIPTCESETRYLVFTDNAKALGKIGSIAPTRGYISNFAKNFDSILVSYGSDDTVSYTSVDLGAAHLDIEKNTGYSYTEYSKYNYSNGDLISAGLINTNISTAKNQSYASPYVFADFDSVADPGNMSVKTVTIPFSSTSETELYYSVSSKTYKMSKNGNGRLDTLTESPLEFKNVFVLFADSVTYEGEDGAELLMNTIGEGKGVYVSCGTAKNITWRADPLGNMTFFDEQGSVLTVNRGESYIGFIKASKMAEVKFS